MWGRMRSVIAIDSTGVLAMLSTRAVYVAVHACVVPRACIAESSFTGCETCDGRRAFSIQANTRGDDLDVCLPWSICTVYDRQIMCLIPLDDYRPLMTARLMTTRNPASLRIQYPCRNSDVKGAIRTCHFSSQADRSIKCLMRLPSLIALFSALHLTSGINSPPNFANPVRYCLLHVHLLSHMAVHLHCHHFHHVSPVHSFTLN